MISAIVVEVARSLSSSADSESTTWSSTLRYMRIGAVTLLRSATVTFQSLSSDANATTGIRSVAGSWTPGLRMSPPISGRDLISHDMYGACLLYTSDAADEEDSVDLG